MTSWALPNRFANAPPRCSALVGLALTVSVGYRVELAAAQRADAVPAMETEAFVVAPPRGKWVEGSSWDGVDSCTGRANWALKSMMESLRLIPRLRPASRAEEIESWKRPNLSTLNFCRWTEHQVDIAGPANHFFWGISIVAIRLADDSLAADDPARALMLADSLQGETDNFPRPYKWIAKDRAVLQVGGVPYQLLHQIADPLESPWVALRVHQGVAYVFISQKRPAPKNEEYYVLQSLRPLSER